MKHIVYLAITVLTGSVAHAADVAVFPPTAVNFGAGQAEAVATLLAQAYANVSHQEVLTPKQAGAPAGGDLAAAARTLGVSEYLETSIVGLLSDGDSGEGRIIIQASRRAADGTLIHRAEMTASSMGDVQVVTERLARALFEKRSPEATRTIRSVTGREAAPENRTFSERIMGLKTQFAQPLASGKSFEPLVSFGFGGRLEARNYFLELGAGLTVGSDSSTSRSGYGGLWGEIGGSVYLSEGSTSPYVGAGISPRLFGGGDSAGAWLAVYGQTGLMFMRESSTRLYVDLRVTQNLVPYKETVYLNPPGGCLSGDCSETRNYYPTEIGLQVGIGW